MPSWKRVVALLLCFQPLPWGLSFLIGEGGVKRQRLRNGALGANNGEIDMPAVPAEWKGQLLRALSSIIDPDFNKDIVSLGFVQNPVLDPDTRQLAFEVQLTTAACPIKETFRDQCLQVANSFPWTNGRAIVSMTSPSDMVTSPNAPMGLSRVKAIIAVSSCKGGVGKSTTAVNLAFALSALGATVGIFDADLFGPSLPTMVQPDNDMIQFVGRQIAPLARNGVKLMSFGYVNQGSAVMRGPMVTQLLDQLVSVTYWGPLDYLVLDLPPGTGDIQLTLCQNLNITAAVIVTTPQELSFVDVERGIEMFDSVQVPCVAVVENMAYLDMNKEIANLGQQLPTQTINYDALQQEFRQILTQETLFDKDSRRLENIVSQLTQRVETALTSHYSTRTYSSSDPSSNPSSLRIFGPGHKQRLSRQWGIEHTFSVPLLSTIAHDGDSGTPFVLKNPSTAEALIFKDLASAVVREIAKIQYAHGNNTKPMIRFEEDAHVLQIDMPDEDKVGTLSGSITPASLRRQCKCASCVEELSGRQILLPWTIPDTIKPRKMTPTGNYAWSIDWSDGHKSLYPFRQIRSILQSEETLQETQQNVLYPMKQ